MIVFNLISLNIYSKDTLNKEINIALLEGIDCLEIEEYKDNIILNQKDIISHKDSIIELKNETILTSDSLYDECQEIIFNLDDYNNHLLEENKKIKKFFWIITIIETCTFIIINSVK